MQQQDPYFYGHWPVLKATILPVQRRTGQVVVLEWHSDLNSPIVKAPSGPAGQESERFTLLINDRIHVGRADRSLADELDVK